MKESRQEDIIRMLQQSRIIRTEELVKHFGVSIETIRRDIASLVQGGLVKKVYGGIQVVDEEAASPEIMSWNRRATKCREEKTAIARKTLEFIADHSTIALDIGTTTLALSALLGEKKGLTILTSSLRIASELCTGSKHTVYMIGGNVYAAEKVTMGTFAHGFLDNFSSIDLFVGSADGLSLTRDITESTEAVADVKRQLVALSSKVVIMADHTKFGKEFLFKSCALSRINTLITDQATPPQYLEALGRQGFSDAFEGDTHVLTNARGA